MRWLGLLLAFGCEAPTGLLLTPPPPPPPPKMPVFDAGMRPRPRDAGVTETLPAQLFPEVVDFGSVVVGEVGYGRLNALNPNLYDSVRVTIISEPPSYFSVRPQYQLISPNSSEFFELGFIPTHAGTYVFDLEVDTCSNDGCITNVPMTGNGIEEMPRPDAGPISTCGNTGPCPTQLVFGPVPVGTEALWNFYCSCPESANFSSAQIDPPIEGASIRRVDAERLFLSFVPVTAGEFTTNVVFRENEEQLIVPLLLIAE